MRGTENPENVVRLHEAPQTSKRLNRMKSLNLFVNNVGRHSPKLRNIFQRTGINYRYFVATNAKKRGILKNVTLR